MSLDPGRCGLLSVPSRRPRGHPPAGRCCRRRPGHDERVEVRIALDALDPPAGDHPGQRRRHRTPLHRSGSACSECSTRSWDHQPDRRPPPQIRRNHELRTTTHPRHRLLVRNRPRHGAPARRGRPACLRRRRKPDDGDRLVRSAAGESGEITPLILDVTEPGHIAAAAAAIDEHTASAGLAGLDGLVNNAGYGLACPAELVPLDAFRRQLDVNVTGQLAVTQAMLPALRRARGRIVMVSTIGVRFSPPFAGPLDAAKAALTALGEALRQELAPWGIRVVRGRAGHHQQRRRRQGDPRRGRRHGRGRSGRPRPVRGCLRGDAPGHGAPGGERQPARRGRRHHHQGADQPVGPGPSTCRARTRGGWPSSAGCPPPCSTWRAGASSGCPPPAPWPPDRCPAEAPSQPSPAKAGQQQGRWPAPAVTPYRTRPGLEPGHRVARPAMPRLVRMSSPSASRRLVAWAISPMVSGLRMNEP